MTTNLSRRALFTLGRPAALAAPLAVAAAEEKAWRAESPRETIRKKYFPDVALTTHEGKRVRLYEDLIRGKIVTLNYMYVSCGDGTCPITTHNLVQTQKLLRHRIGRDIFMYSITLDPEFDTPQELKKYARLHGAGPGWLFLRPDPKDAEMLRRRLGYYDLDPVVDAQRSTHGAMLRCGNEPRQLWGTASGFAAPEIIARAIQWVAGPSRLQKPPKDDHHHHAAAGAIA